MDILSLFGETAKVWVIIPAVICIARITDVSIGTVRVIFVSKGMKLLASVLGFFEVLIWLVVIGEVMQNLTQWQNYIGYATGFALGNYVGIAIEARLAFGTVLLRVITAVDAGDLIAALREKNYGVTCVDGEGKYGPVKILMMLVARTELPQTLEIVDHHNPHAFYSIEDVRSVKEGIFPTQKSSFRTKEFFIRKVFRVTK